MSTSATTQDSIQKAISELRVIEFQYDGMVRTVNPHMLGESNGEAALLGWQRGGSSSEPGLPDWRQFSLAKISDLQVSLNRFCLEPGFTEEYKNFDRVISSVLR